MLETLFHRLFTPGEVFLDRLALLAAILVCDFQQALGGIRAAIKDDILDAFSKLRINLVINVELARIHNAHIHARRNGVIEEDRVHGAAHRLVAAE